MTEQQIDALEAGPEMNALIGEYAFGYVWVTMDRQKTRLLVPPDKAELYVDLGETLEVTGLPLRRDYGDWIPDFSGTWNGAWLVWEKMPEAKALDEAGRVFSARFHCEWGAEGWELGYYAEGPTAPLAICRAALKTVLLG